MAKSLQSRLTRIEYNIRKNTPVHFIIFFPDSNGNMIRRNLDGTCTIYTQEEYKELEGKKNIFKLTMPPDAQRFS